MYGLPRNSLSQAWTFTPLKDALLTPTQNDLNPSNTSLQAADRTWAAVFADFDGFFSSNCSVHRIQKTFGRQFKAFVFLLPCHEFLRDSGIDTRLSSLINNHECSNRGTATCVTITQRRNEDSKMSLLTDSEDCSEN